MVVKLKNFGGYAIGSDGSIYSVTKDNRLKEKALRPDKDGYIVVKLCFNGKPKLCKVHRLVAEAFIPKVENKPVVNHKNGQRNDNRVENLEWVTVQENNQHAYSSNGRIGLS